MYTPTSRGQYYYCYDSLMIIHLHPWEWPKTPWTRLHLDYTGPFIGTMFLVIIDAHSKWLEVVPVSSANSSQTVMALRQVFATHGIPEIIVSDNGSAFTSSEFEMFTKQNGIRHLKTAPHHPSTNGLAERAVQVFKRGMKKSGPGELKTKLARFLLHYRTTPHATTGTTPAELLMGRSPRTHLDMLRPNISARVEGKQLSQKLYHDDRSRERSFLSQEKVYVREAGNNSPWIAGVIESRQGSVHYGVKLENGRLVKRHIDQIQPRISTPIDVPENQLDEDTFDQIDIPSFSNSIPPTTTTQPNEPSTQEVRRDQELPRRSKRIQCPPARYGNPLLF